MRTLRILAMVMLAFLYLGGMYGHLSGAAFPVIGTGHKAVDHFEGVAKDPIHPTIAECRHIPLVKLLVISPPLAVDLFVVQRTEDFQILVFPNLASSLLAAHPMSPGGRAPPQS